MAKKKKRTFPGPKYTQEDRERGAANKKKLIYDDAGTEEQYKRGLITLGFQPGARKYTQKEIQRSFRRKSIRLHPDKGGKMEDFKKFSTMKRAMDTYRTKTIPDKRAEAMRHLKYGAKVAKRTWAKEIEVHKLKTLKKLKDTIAARRIQRSFRIKRAIGFNSKMVSAYNFDMEYDDGGEFDGLFNFFDMEHGADYWDKGVRITGSGERNTMSGGPMDNMNATEAINYFKSRFRTPKQATKFAKFIKEMEKYSFADLAYEAVHLHLDMSAPILDEDFVSKMKARLKYAMYLFIKNKGKLTSFQAQTAIRKETDDPSYDEEKKRIAETAGMSFQKIMKKIELGKIKVFTRDDGGEDGDETIGALYKGDEPFGAQVGGCCRRPIEVDEEFVDLMKERREVKKYVNKKFKGSWDAFKTKALRLKMDAFLNQYSGIDDAFRERLWDRWEQTGSMPLKEHTFNKFLATLEDMDSDTDSDDEYNIFDGIWE